MGSTHHGAGLSRQQMQRRQVCRMTSSRWSLATSSMCSLTANPAARLAATDSGAQLASQLVSWRFVIRT